MVQWNDHRRLLFINCHGRMCTDLPSMQVPICLNKLLSSMIFELYRLYNLIWHLLTYLVICLVGDYVRLGQENYVASNVQYNTVQYNGYNCNSDVTAAECGDFCTATDGCGHFVHCADDGDRCCLYDLKLAGNEATYYHGTCSTYYQKGIFPSEL